MKFDAFLNIKKHFMRKKILTAAIVMASIVAYAQKYESVKLDVFYTLVFAIHTAWQAQPYVFFFFFSLHQDQQSQDQLPFAGYDL